MARELADVLHHFLGDALAEERLGAVLSDPARGDFAVEVLLDRAHASLTRAIASFCH